MHRLKILAMLGSFAVTACVSVDRRPAIADAVFTTKPCAPELAAAAARCGSITVPENRTEPRGRMIDLNVIVFPATRPGRDKAAQFDLEGGPGYGVTGSAMFYATDGVAFREHRDVVLVDMRGTGGSNPLRCEGIEAYERTQPAAPMYPADLVSACARQLAARADVRQYSTAAASRDLDAVRNALGYAQIDLNAISYGTTLALRYIADYPSHVRSAVLTGTVPADKTPPAHHARSAERGLQGLFDACAADHVCADAYPDLRTELDTAMQRTAHERRAPFMERLRTMMYMAGSARRIPSLIRAIARGDDSSMTKAAEAGRVFADGSYLSITCSETFARIDVDAAIAESERTPFGSYRLTRQRDACAQWPIAPPDPHLFRTGKYEVPVLFLSGALDPVTPPEWSAQAATMFPNSRHVIVPQGGHVFDGMTGFETCIDAIVLQFVATRSVDAIDAACTRTMEAGPFVVP